MRRSRSGDSLDANAPQRRSTRQCVAAVGTVFMVCALLWTANQQRKRSADMRAFESRMAQVESYVENQQTRLIADLATAQVRATQMRDAFDALTRRQREGGAPASVAPAQQLNPAPGGGGTAPEGSPVELRDVLGKCYTMVDGGQWWTYEVCSTRQVRQFHQGDSEFSLGVYKGAIRQSTGVYEEIYDGGTPCGGQLSRKTTVRWECGAVPAQPNNGVQPLPTAQPLLAGITHIEEPAQCTYVVHMKTQRLC